MTIRIIRIRKRIITKVVVVVKLVLVYVVLIYVILVVLLLLLVVVLKNIKIDDVEFNCIIDISRLFTEGNDAVPMHRRKNDIVEANGRGEIGRASCRERV